MSNSMSRAYKMTRTVNIYFLIQVLEKGVHIMRYNYSEETIHLMKEWDCYERTEEELQQVPPEEAFIMFLTYEGIFGYDFKILRTIERLWGIRLCPCCPSQSKKDFIRGFGSFLRYQEMCTGVQTMEMNDKELVTITYEGGGTHTANVAADSHLAALRDILKNTD